MDKQSIGKQIDEVKIQVGEAKSKGRIPPKALAIIDTMLVVLDILVAIVLKKKTRYQLFLAVQGHKPLEDEDQASPGQRGRREIPQEDGSWRSFTRVPSICSPPSKHFRIALRALRNSAPTFSKEPESHPFREAPSGADKHIGNAYTANKEILERCLDSGDGMPLGRKSTHNILEYLHESSPSPRLQTEFFS